MREAHASDEWPMGNHVVVPQPTSMMDRARVAMQFVTATGLLLEVFLDGLNDHFMHAFSVHPQRFFVIDDSGKLSFKATPHEGEYALEDLDRILGSACGTP